MLVGLSVLWLVATMAGAYLGALWLLARLVDIGDEGPSS